MAHDADHIGRMFGHGIGGMTTGVAETPTAEDGSAPGRTGCGEIGEMITDHPTCRRSTSGLSE
jgi:hypothetical protein